MTPTPAAASQVMPRERVRALSELAALTVGIARARAYDLGDHVIAAHARIDVLLDTLGPLTDADLARLAEVCAKFAPRRPLRPARRR